MTPTNLKAKVEYGDFQTPLELSKMVCQKLIALGINPNVIIEPTCGVGNFIEAATNSFVEACLLFCKFDSCSHKYFCDVFSDLQSSNYLRIGYRNNTLIRDVESFDKLENLYDINSKTKWRSGVKHDCSNIMEFSRSGDSFINGLGEVVNIEETYLLPLFKGSDIAQNRTKTTERFVLVTQRFVGEQTESIKFYAPKTWNYLEAHATYLDNRKSKIYQNKPRFSMFGIGDYTFAPWKIAICGLYKKLDFRLIGKINDRPVILDDTVYFLGFDEETTASETFELLTSISAINFYSSLL